MSRFKVGDLVTPVNVDRYNDIMKQLVGKTLVVNLICTDKSGREIVWARVPGEECWLFHSDDLRLVSETQDEPTAPAPAAAKKPIRRGDLVEYDGRVCVVAENDIEGGVCSVAALTGEHGYDHVPTDELKHIGSIRKKVKRLKAQMDGGK